MYGTITLMGPMRNDNLTQRSIHINVLLSYSLIIMLYYIYTHLRVIKSYIKNRED